MQLALWVVGALCDEYGAYLADAVEPKSKGLMHLGAILRLINDPQSNLTDLLHVILKRFVVLQSEWIGWDGWISGWGEVESP